MNFINYAMNSFDKKDVTSFFKTKYNFTKKLMMK